MHLKISSTKKLIFKGEVSQINLPSENGEIAILEWHTPLITTLKPWLIKIIPKDQFKKSDFIFSKNVITLSVSKGMAYTDWKIVRVVTAIATTNPDKTEKELMQEEKLLKEKISILKQKGSIEEVEKTLIKLDKVDADIRLTQLKKQRG